MEFILDQQAQFATSMQRLEEAQAKTDERIRALVDVSLSLANHVEGLANHVKEIDRREFCQRDQGEDPEAGRIPGAHRPAAGSADRHRQAPS
jgi:hypothetical protein